MRLLNQTLFLAGLALSSLTISAQAADEVTVAYQTVIDPSKVAQADGLYEKLTGVKINWRKFDTGAEVITAVASGDVQVGYVGSSPIAAAASRDLPITTFLIAAKLGESEALVVRNGSKINQPQDLIGKKIAVPFVSTGHYSLLAALKHWKISPAKVQIINLRPPEITAAWQRGDIDAAYVWDPALGKAKQSGKVLTTSAEVAKWGSPTFDAWIVRKDFAEKHPDFLEKFSRVTLDAYAAYRNNPNAWISNADNLDKVIRLTGANKEEIPGVLASNIFPLVNEQIELLGPTTAKALADTSDFLKEQGKVDSVQKNYLPFVSNAFVKGGKQVATK
ncbi:taurine ABC transporter substrate-binding protein [Uliginosibacterium gangwonense]|uniref:taurine ABC transporter substrate-binding protein n=1 Tax=Uliginosibacterium gangwonense TaxID=392736 RepID=UPI000366A5F8|nr:taurine ABC transporter substrate-binding protein [Uliginosibacterium gangwonense]